MRAYLSDGTLPLRSHSNILKQAETFFLGPNGRLYYKKTLRDSAVTLKLPVVRSYEERMQVCKTIHLSTGEENIHHRRDTMLELLGQQYYWKGQRRDVCQCVSVSVFAFAKTTAMKYPINLSSVRYHTGTGREIIDQSMWLSSLCLQSLLCIFCLTCDLGYTLPLQSP